MTEQEWLDCTDPGIMLAFVRGKVSDRKLRLFAAACARMVWDQFQEEISRRAIEVAERYADGLASEEEFAEARRLAQVFQRKVACRFHNHNYRNRPITLLISRDRFVGQCSVAPLYRSAIRAAYWAAGGASGVIVHCEGISAYDRVNHTLSCLIREISGNPFRSTLLDSSCLPWNDRTIPKIAHEIYDDRAFDRLPILADALEEAGCTNADILNHCRQPGEHVRGCWVVDLLLGKS